MKNHLYALTLTTLLCTSASQAAIATSTETDYPSTKSHGQTVVIDKTRVMARHQPIGQPLAWVDSVYVEALTDLNGNGYASRFRVQFDADTRLATQTIYAELSLTDGVQSWPFFVTEPLTLRSTHGDDAYQVTTTLTDTYPTGVYAMVIRLYDATTRELLVEADRMQYPELNAHYLESADLDSVQHSTAYLDYHRVTLFDDLDGSGYFSSLSLTVDVDYPQRADRVSVSLLAEVPGLGWQTLLNSHAFRVEGVREADRQTFSVTLQRGIPRGLYRYKLRVIHADSGHIMDEFNADASAALALQSSDRAAPHYHDDHGDDYYEDGYYEDEYYGGSVSGLMLLLAGVGWLRRRAWRTLAA